MAYVTAVVEGNPEQALNAAREHNIAVLAYHASTGETVLYVAKSEEAKLGPWFIESGLPFSGAREACRTVIRRISSESSISPATVSVSGGRSNQNTAT